MESPTSDQPPRESAPLLAVEKPPSRFERIQRRACSPIALLCFFIWINLLNYSDRGLISLVTAPGNQTAGSDSYIGSPDPDHPGEYYLGKTESGVLASAFMLGFMVCCPLFAALADVIGPLRVITLGLTIWSLSVMATGMSFNYWFLVTARLFTGAGEASFAGLAPSVIDDTSPPRQRTLRLGGFFAMISVGYAVGYGIGAVMTKNVDLTDSFLGPHYGQGWRFGFLLIGLLGLPSAWLVLLTPSAYVTVNRKARKTLVSEPEVSAPDTEKPEEIDTDEAPEMSVINESFQRKLPPGWERQQFTLPQAMKALFTNPLFLALTYGYSAYTFVIGALAYFAPTFAGEFDKDAGLEAQNLIIGGITVVTGIFGTAFGGAMVDKLGGSAGTPGFARSLKFSVLVTLLAFPLGVGCFLISVVHPIPTYILLALAEFLLFSTTSPINSSIMTVVPHKLRGYAMGVNVFFIHLLGDFPSPTITGAMAESFFHGKITYALLIVFFYLIACVISWGCVAFFAHRRQRSLRKWLQLAPVPTDVRDPLFLHAPSAEVVASD
eukprot:NODE_643_length_1886_cov_10.705498_g515_i0.p1 GENE.NODE_643_length_1886_cov_10.705498_g515_i0~~NODE_643_length_1886_cov_10.705498_g515_i0.p1  ORF type:complete len:550 (+),score=54.47 NODE_643_length_1886_cov_10.705498_g515_i0:151-1800(+)